MIIYDFDSYKTYLKAYLDSLPLRGHGEKSRIAQALQCQSAYFSQVLNGNADLSLEQTDRLATYLSLSEEDSDFLFLLVELARAGSKTLSDRLKRKIQKIREQRKQLKNRIQYKDTLSLADETEYFRNWVYAVVHLMVSIPSLQTRDTLLRTLKIDSNELSRVLAFLLKAGLIEEKKGRFATGPVNLFLGNDSKLIQQHHTNWRLRAINSLSNEKPEDLHYSAAVSISQNDVTKVREILLGAVQQVRAVVKDSKNEDAIFSYGVDLFEMYKF